MKALLIKYHGPTQTKGSRISVRSHGCKAIYVPYEYETDLDTNIKHICEMYFAQIFNIDTDKQSFAVGTLPNGDYTAVLI